MIFKTKVIIESKDYPPTTTEIVFSKVDIVYFYKLSEQEQEDYQDFLEEGEEAMNMLVQYDNGDREIFLVLDSFEKFENLVGWQN